MDQAQGSRPIICTIIAKNYLAAARCLTDSFLEHHPDGQVFVLVIDEFEGYFDPGQERFTTVRLNEIGINGLVLMLYRYTVLELSTAVKPFFLEYLFRQCGCERLCYFDPDIYFYQPLTEIWDLLALYGIVLIPHLLDFLDDEFWPGELNFLQVGSYNLGFIGLSQHPELDRFLHWWQNKLTRHCVVDPDKGLFVDQKWIDLVPSFFSSVYIHRDPGCNVAYWNLNHRSIACRAGTYIVNDTPLKFFHFSGFSPERMDILSKHQNRFTFENASGVKPLFERYRDCLLTHDYATARQWPYTHNYEPGLGVKIPDAARVLWKDWELSHSTLSSTDPVSLQNLMVKFLTWLNEPIGAANSTQPPLTRLALAVYQQHPNLSQIYPDILRKNRRQYQRWFLRQAKVRFDLDDFFIRPMQSRQSLVAKHLQQLGARSYQNLVEVLHWIGIGSWLEEKLGERTIGPVRSFFTSSSQPAVPEPPSALTTPNFANAPFGLNVVGYLHDENGVGEVARSSLKALHQQGFPVTYTLVSSYAYRQNDHSVAHLPEGYPYAFNCLYVNADQVKTVYNELGPEFFKGKYNIGYWHWELGRFPAEWLDSFRYFNEIWVASNFVQNTVAQVSPVPVITIGNHVEKRPPTHITRAQLGLPEDKFLFFFIFDMYSVIERKNPFGLIEAYRRAFGDQAKDTELVIKVANLEKFPQYQARLEQAMKSISGILINGYLNREMLHGLFYNSDVYISLHRSEGFGMTMAEGMCLGKPVIATAYSANTDFMNVNNSYLVGYRLVELAEDYGPYKKGEVWADPDLDQAAAHMRRVFENPSEAARIAAQAAADIQQMYGHEAIAQKIMARLNTICARFP